MRSVPSDIPPRWSLVLWSLLLFFNNQRSDPTLENTALLTFVLVSTLLSHLQQGKTVTDKNVVFNLSRPDVACWQLVLLSNDKPSLHEAFAFAVHLHLGQLT